MRQFYLGCDQLHAVSLLLRCDAMSMGNLLPKCRNKLAHTSSWSEIFLILSTLEYETTSLSRNVECRLSSNTASYSTLLKVRRRGIYCGKAKTVRCRT